MTPGAAKEPGEQHQLRLSAILQHELHCFSCKYGILGYAIPKYVILYDYIILDPRR